MVRISLILVFSFLLSHAIAGGPKPPLVLFRIFVQTNGEGQSTLETAHISVPPDGESILIRAVPELTEHELVGVNEQADGTLRFEFNHTGRIDLDAATAQNEGRVLVVTVNGEVIYAPIIDAHLTNGELVVPHRLNSTLVRQLQATAAKNVQEANRA